MSPRAPLWLAAPSRLAGLGRVPARWVAGGTALVLLVALVTAAPSLLLSDPVHAAMLDSLRHGGHFYITLHDLARGTPEAASRLEVPTLAIVEAALPRLAFTMLLAALLTVILWSGATRIGMTMRAGIPRLGAMVLLAYGLAAGTLLAIDMPRAGWASLLMTLALLLRRPERWIEAAAIGAAAALVDLSALPALLILAGLALVDGTRREAIGWLVATLLAAAAAASHAAALATLSLPPAVTPAALEGGAAALIGTAAFPLLPGPVAAVCIVLAALGWAAMRPSLALRVALLLTAGIMLEGIAGLHPIVMLAPLLPLGLAAAPDVLRDLASAALQRRRRITVTRLSRPRALE